MKCSKVTIVVFTAVLCFSYAVPASAGNSCSDTAWLIKAYNDALYRAPSNQEISSWIDPQTLRLRNGAARDFAYWGMEISLEGQVDWLGGNSGTVAGYFQLVLGRAPTTDELNTFIDGIALSIGAGEVPDMNLIAALMGG